MFSNLYCTALFWYIAYKDSLCSTRFHTFNFTAGIIIIVGTLIFLPFERRFRNLCVCGFQQYVYFSTWHQSYLYLLFSKGWFSDHLVSLDSLSFSDHCVIWSHFKVSHSSNTTINPSRSEFCRINSNVVAYCIRSHDQCDFVILDYTNECVHFRLLHCLSSNNCNTLFLDLRCFLTFSNVPDK